MRIVILMDNDVFEQMYGHVDAALKNIMTGYFS